MSLFWINARFGPINPKRYDFSFCQTHREKERNKEREHQQTLYTEK